MKKTYKQYRDEERAKFNALPIKWAFSMEQFRKSMEEWGLTENDTDKLYKLGDSCGGFYRKEDAPIIRAYYEREDEFPKLMEDEEFAIDAFEYEMANHEYAINWQGDWDVCNCFSNKDLKYGEDKTYVDYLTEMGHEEWIGAYRKARKNHYKMAENW